MYTSKERGGLTASPVQPYITDSRNKKLLKILVSSMISFHPKDRPSINDVLAELESISGRINHLVPYLIHCSDIKFIK